MEDINTNTVTATETALQIYRTNSSGKYQTRAAGEITLVDLLQKIKDPSKTQRQLIDKIRVEDDDEKRKELKSKLPGYIIQSVNDGKRRMIKNVTHFTGYTVLDFDGKTVKGYAKELKKFLFDTYDCIKACYISPSGKVKAIIRIGVAQSIDEYRDYYRAIQTYFGQYEGFDPTPTNPVLIMYLTHDEDILIRENPGVWMHKEYKKEAPKTDVESVQGDEVDTKRVYAWVSAKLNAIDDNGHPQLIASAKLLGGFCGFYSMDLFEAQQWLHSKIEQHGYLSKDIENYKKTATYFIKEGAKNPIPLKHR